MPEARVMVITGTRTGIGRHLAAHYADAGYTVVGCSRKASDLERPNYTHHALDVADEAAVRHLFAEVRTTHGRLDALINNAGVASMNHMVLTPMRTVEAVLQTNVGGTFLCCREAAKLMRRRQYGRIVNMATVATPLKLEGEALYAASKAAVVSLTEILARELAPWGITVNALGPTPMAIGLTRGVPQEKLDALLARQALPRLAEPPDLTNVIDFFLRPESDFVTGQTLYLGGV